MHEKSGLIAALGAAGTVPLEEAEKALLALLDRFDLGPEHPFVWGGFSPGAIDRPVVGCYMPTYYRRIHHRSLDMSAVKLALQNWLGVNAGKELDHDPAHRALADTLECVQAAREARRILEDLRRIGAESCQAAEVSC